MHVPDILYVEPHASLSLLTGCILLLHPTAIIAWLNDCGMLAYVEVWVVKIQVWKLIVIVPKLIYAPISLPNV
jgi:hypothetical protein